MARLRHVLPEVQVALVSSNQVSNLLRREADIAVRMVQPGQTSLLTKRIGKITLGILSTLGTLGTLGTFGPRSFNHWAASLRVLRLACL